MTDAAALAAAARAQGLAVVGIAAANATPESVRDDPDYAGIAAFALLGPLPGVFWPVFSASPEAADRAPDPIDRWSRRVGDALADQLSARAYYPFGGPPYRPFLGWAAGTGRLWSSPIGPLVGADHGLLVSFRLALGFPTALASAPATRPCDRCAETPCAAACPVDAFAGGAYDVAQCRAHIGSAAGAECLSRGCLARRACPAAANALQPPAQATLHMRAFLAAGAAP